MAEDKDKDPTGSEPSASDPAEQEHQATDERSAADSLASDAEDEGAVPPDGSGTSSDDTAVSADEAELPGDSTLTEDPGPDEDTGPDEETGPDEDTGPEEDEDLVPAGAAVRSSKAGRAPGATSTVSGSERGQGKGRATPRRDQAPVAPARTGPVTFVKESAAELRKVVYPTGEQLRTFFIVVLIFVLFIIALASLLDLVFGALILRIFG